VTGLVARFALGSLLSPVGEKLKSGWAWITQSALHLTLAALAVALLAVWYYRHESAKWQRVVSSMEVAQKKAAEDQAAVNHEPARVSQEIAEKSNAQGAAYHADVRVAASRAAVRLRPPGGTVVPSSVPGADTAEPGVHGPADPPALVCRPSIDDSQLIEAAARAAQMHQEALDMIAAGIATEAAAP